MADVRVKDLAAVSAGWLDDYTVIDRITDVAHKKVAARDLLGMRGCYTNGAVAEGASTCVVDSTAKFAVGMRVAYALGVSSVIEYNTVASITNETTMVLGAVTGPGGIADDAYIMPISPGEYAAATAIRYGGSFGYTLPASLAAAGGRRMSVRAWGATGDGVTDDATAIQAALDDANENDVVEFPEGTYLVGATLTLATNTVTLQGNGKASIVGDTAIGDVLDISGTNTLLRNLDVSGNGGANGGYGINLSGAGLYLENVRVSGTTLAPVRTTSVWSVCTVNCLFDASDSNAGEAGFYHGADSNNVLHLRSRFVGGATNTGCKIASGAQLDFVGCDFSGSLAGTATGLDIVLGYAINVRGCYFEWLGTYAIHVGSAGGQPVGVNILGNWINQNDNAGNIGVQVTGCYNATIDGNVMLGNSAGGEVGIGVASDDQAVFGLRIGQDNYIYGVATEVDDTRNRADNLRLMRIKRGSAAPTDGSYYDEGDIIWNSGATAGGYAGWICVYNGCAAKGYWTTGTLYAIGDYVVNSGSKVYRATTAGVSGVTEPVHVAGTASDGGVTWQYIAGSQDLAIFKTFGAISA